MSEMKLRPASETVGSDNCLKCMRHRSICCCAPSPTTEAVWTPAQMDEITRLIHADRQHLREQVEALSLDGRGWSKHERGIYQLAITDVLALLDEEPKA